MWARLSAFDSVRRCLARFCPCRELLSGLSKVIRCLVDLARCKVVPAKWTEGGSCVNSAQPLWGEVGVYECRGVKARPTVLDHGNGIAKMLFAVEAYETVPESCEGSKATGHRRSELLV